MARRTGGESYAMKRRWEVLSPRLHDMVTTGSFLCQGSDVFYGCGAIDLTVSTICLGFSILGHVVVQLIDSSVDGIHRIHQSQYVVGQWI